MTYGEASLALALVALGAEAAVGYPAALFARIGHPVTWIGLLIAALDRGWNRDAASDPTRRLLGVAAVAVLVATAGLAGAALQTLAVAGGWLGLVAAGVLASSLLAQNSLHEHVAAVAAALRSGGVEAGRIAVARIVGRNPATLDEAAICRAAIESLAENFSDGIVAPAFWLALGGPPGGAIYKAVNTADSMIGHLTARHRAFGWAAARLDDGVNLPASRLSALLLVAAACFPGGGDPAAAWRAIRRDAGHHRSPNAGYPEAAMAGALGLRLAGPRVYGTTRVEDGWMGDGRADATPADIDRALGLYRVACWLLAGLVAVAFAALILVARRPG